MAYSSAGGTDSINYSTVLPTLNTQATLSFWFNTTQATTNAILAGHWSATSRNGWGILLNNVANKLSLICYDNTTTRVHYASTEDVNNGAWHNAVITLDITSGQANTMYIDGALSNTANASAVWNSTSDKTLLLFDSVDAFWPTYVGAFGEFAYWDGVKLTAGEAAALGSGASPRLVRPQSLLLYSPLVRSSIDRKAGVAPSVTGTTVSGHAPIIGGMF